MVGPEMKARPGCEDMAIPCRASAVSSVTYTSKPHFGYRLPW